MGGHTAQLHETVCKGALQVGVRQVKQVLRKQCRFPGNASPSQHRNTLRWIDRHNSGRQFWSAIEHAAALEEKAPTKSERIPELEASVDRKNVLTKATEYAASTVKYGGKNNDPKELRATRKQLMDSVTFHAATLVALSVKTYSGGGGGGARNTQMNKARPGLHLCVQCKRDVYHKEGNCLELAANKDNHYTGWKIVLE